MREIMYPNNTRNGQAPELVARNDWVAYRARVALWSVGTALGFGAWYLLIELWTAEAAGEPIAWYWYAASPAILVGIVAGLIGVVAVPVAVALMRRVSFSRGGVMTVKPLARPSRRYDDVDHVEVQEWVNAEPPKFFALEPCFLSELDAIPVSDDGFLWHTEEDGTAHKHEVEAELVAWCRNGDAVTIVERGRVPMAESHRRARQVSDFAGLAGEVARHRFYQFPSDDG